MSEERGESPQPLAPPEPSAAPEPSPKLATGPGLPGRALLVFGSIGSGAVCALLFSYVVYESIYAAYDLESGHPGTDPYLSLHWEWRNPLVFLALVAVGGAVFITIAASLTGVFFSHRLVIRRVGIVVISLAALATALAACLPHFFFPALGALFIGIMAFAFGSVTRQEKLHRASAVAFAVATVLALSTLYVPGARLLYAGDVGAARRYCESLVPDLEAYRREHGTYPKELSEIPAARNRPPRLLRLDPLASPLRLGEPLTLPRQEPGWFYRREGAGFVFMYVDFWHCCVYEYTSEKRTWNLAGMW